MDTEKYRKLKGKMDQGLSPNDEGPYYHHAWWESYKGSVKGKFGGLAIGAVIGALVGTAVAASVGFAGGAFIIGGFASAGALFGTKEFGTIGKVTGAVSAAQEEAEVRMKLYEEGKFTEIKQDIAELKAIIKGDQAAAQAAKSKSEAIANKEHDDSYRTTHYAQLKPDAQNRFVFWKIALLGLAVGAAAGALFAFSGAADVLLKGLGKEAVVGMGGKLLGSIAAFGALGASFGINRDIFRKIFDKTDLWFKGMFNSEKVREHQREAGLKITNGKKTVADAAAQIEKESQKQGAYTSIDYPESDTYHQDKVLAAAEKALLSFDHTRATPH